MEGLVTRLKDLLTVVDESGNPVMLFGGRISLSQFILFCAVVVVALSLLRFAKGVMKLLAAVVIVVGLCVNFGILSKEEVKGAITQVTDAGMDAVGKIAETADNVRVKNGTVEIKLDGEWHDVTDFDTFEIATGKVVIWMNGVRYDVEDSNIVAALEALMN